MSYYVDVQANVSDPLGGNVTGVAVAFESDISDLASVQTFVASAKPAGGVVPLVDPHTASDDVSADGSEHYVRAYLTTVFSGTSDNTGSSPANGGTYHTYAVMTNDAPFTKVFKI